MFAKLYGNDDDQILVMLQENAENGGVPELRFFFEPEGLGVCSVASIFEDGCSTSWVKAQKAFDNMTEEKARKIIDTVKPSIIQEFYGETSQ